MGYYINQNTIGEDLPTKGKVEALMADGATETDSAFKENLVAVLHRIHFDAANFVYSEHELQDIMFTSCPVTYLVYPPAAVLSGYKK